jgi:hypothetical protein
VGQDGKGKRGLTGSLIRMMQDDPKIAAKMIKWLLRLEARNRPRPIEGSQPLADEPYGSVEEVRAASRAGGLPDAFIDRLEHSCPQVGDLPAAAEKVTPSPTIPP